MGWFHRCRSPHAPVPRPQKVRCGPPLCSRPARLQPAFTALSVPVVCDWPWHVSLAHCAAPYPPHPRPHPPNWLASRANLPPPLESKLQPMCLAALCPDPLSIQIRGQRRASSTSDPDASRFGCTLGGFGPSFGSFGGWVGSRFGRGLQPLWHAVCLWYIMGEIQFPLGKIICQTP